jgi:hypothetical protein
MENIHVLSTNKPSRLYKSIDNELSFTDIEFEQTNGFNTNQHIYITSDEKLKLRDYIVLDNSIKGLPEYQGLHIIQILDDTLLCSAIALGCKKIILTTDQDLIADGVEQISEDTLLKIVEHINSGKNIESFDEL